MLFCHIIIPKQNPIYKYDSAIEPGRVEEIKEDIEYYIESNDEMEGMEDLDPYEVLQLDEMPAVLVSTRQLVLVVHILYLYCDP